MNPNAGTPSPSNWASRLRFVPVALALIGGGLLALEHWVHVLPFLPWLFLAACPLMHLVMHHGRGGHHRGTHGGASGSGNACALRDETSAAAGTSGPSRAPGKR